MGFLEDWKDVWDTGVLICTCMQDRSIFQVFFFADVLFTSATSNSEMK